MGEPEIRTEPIVHPAAWKAADFSSADDFAFDLSRRHVALLAEAIAPWSGQENVPFETIGRDALPLGELADGIAALREEIMNGRGLVVVRGFPVGDFTDDDILLMYWAFCRHLGRPLCQSSRRQRIGFVTHRPDRAQVLRGYERANRQMLHTDMDAILGMLCVRPARSGGASRLASALAIHNAIAASRPDLLRPLYKGFPLAWGDEPPRRATGGMSEYDVPVFSWAGGQLSMCYLRPQGLTAAEMQGKALPGETVEALDLVDRIGERPGMAVELALAEGECYFINNFIILHARNGFEDWGDPRRHRLLLRSWLEVPDGRAVAPALARYYDDLRSAYGEDLPASGAA